MHFPNYLSSEGVLPPAQLSRAYLRSPPGPCFLMYTYIIPVHSAARRPPCHFKLRGEELRARIRAAAGSTVRRAVGGGDALRRRLRAGLSALSPAHAYQQPVQSGFEQHGALAPVQPVQEGSSQHGVPAQPVQAGFAQHRFLGAQHSHPAACAGFEQLTAFMIMLRTAVEEAVRASATCLTSLAGANATARQMVRRSAKSRAPNFILIAHFYLTASGGDRSIARG